MNSAAAICCLKIYSIFFNKGFKFKKYKDFSYNSAINALTINGSSASSSGLSASLTTVSGTSNTKISFTLTDNSEGAVSAISQVSVWLKSPDRDECWD